MLTYYAIFKFSNLNLLTEEDKASLINFIGVWRTSDANTEERAYETPTWVRIPGSIVFNITEMLMSLGLKGRFVWVDDESFYPDQTNTLISPNHKHAITIDLY